MKLAAKLLFLMFRIKPLRFILKAIIMTLTKVIAKICFWKQDKAEREQKRRALQSTYIPPGQYVKA